MLRFSHQLSILRLKALRLFILSTVVAFSGFAYAHECQKLFAASEISLNNSAKSKGLDPIVEGLPDSEQALLAAHWTNLDHATQTDLERRKFWLTTDVIQSSKSDSIRLNLDDTQDFLLCGQCRYMLASHTKAFLFPMLRLMGQISEEKFKELNITPSAAGKFVLVSVRGEIVGLVKTYGGDQFDVSESGYFKYKTNNYVTPVSTPSFLALKNVVNSRGELVLAAGGVYYISKKFFSESVLPEINRQGPYLPEQNDKGPDSDNLRLKAFFRQFRIGAIDVNKIELMPGVFLFNQYGLGEPSNLEMLAKFFPLTAGSKNPELVQKAWNLYVSHLETIRDWLQKRKAQDPTLKQLRRDLDKAIPPK